MSDLAGKPMRRDRELPVCVLGMARSGTSLTARALNLLGVDLGPEAGFVPSGPHNPTGYWERRAIFELNEAILTTLGGDYGSPPPLEPGWEHLPELAPLKQRARDLLDESFRGSRLWGLKDPRLSLTLPFWRSLIPELRYVICVRDPAEVSASFARYPHDGQFDGTSLLDLWFLSTASALVHTSGSPRLVVFYEDYFADLRTVVELLAALIERQVTPGAFSAIEAFVEPGLRHHSLDFDDSDVAREAPEAGALYTALRRLRSRSGEAQIARVEHLARRLLAAREQRAGGAAAEGRPRPAPAAPPSVLQRFPTDLTTRGLEYFGIHKDGWVERDSYVKLAGGAAADLVVRANVEQRNQRLEVVVSGNSVASREVGPGLLYLRVALPATSSARRIELHWAKAELLPPPDGRSAAARLRSVRLVPRRRTDPLLERSQP